MRWLILRQKDENVFPILGYLFILWKWKKRSQGQVLKQPGKSKEGRRRRSFFFHSVLFFFFLDSADEWMPNAASPVCSTHYSAGFLFSHPASCNLPTLPKIPQKMTTSVAKENQNRRDCEPMPSSCCVCGCVWDPKTFFYSFLNTEIPHVRTCTQWRL